MAWYLSGSERLSPTARTLFDDALEETHQIIVSAIVVAELVLIAEKKRVAIEMDRIAAILNHEPAFQLVDLTSAIALRIQSLVELPDIHDRLIVATALEYSAPVITRDEAITAFELVSTVW